MLSIEINVQNALIIIGQTSQGLISKGLHFPPSSLYRSPLVLTRWPTPISNNMPFLYTFYSVLQYLKCRTSHFENADLNDNAII